MHRWGTPVPQGISLVCNILVASIACYTYFKKGAVSFRLLIPLIVVSVPCAYIGGLISLPQQYYKPLVGVFLLFAAYRTVFTAQGNVAYPVQPASWAMLGGVGALLGFLSGLTGVGGGVFLSPLMLLLRWAPIRTISGVAAGFILVNSISGLVGWLSSSGQQIPLGLEWLLLAVVLGGTLGAELGSHRIRTNTIQKLLAVTLLIAGVKLVATATVISPIR
jgi:uncharacterized protein